VQALGLSFTVATLALAFRLRTSGETLLSAGLALALAAALVGLGLGANARRPFSGPAFQRALFVVFVVLGATNLLRGCAGPWEPGRAQFTSVSTGTISIVTSFDLKPRNSTWTR
jgi:hypothetical protein